MPYHVFEFIIWQGKPSPLKSLFTVFYRIMATFESVQTGNIHIDGGERKMKDLSPLAQDRLQYQPRFPECLQTPEKINVLTLFSFISIVVGILRQHYFQRYRPSYS